ncbi:MAG: zinc metallopeptidase [Sphingobacteriales bacterium]|jgi:Zn-dependent membrane protease YugP
MLYIGFLFMGLGMLVSWVLRRKFTKYSAEGLRVGMSGKEVAEKMLRDNGIYDVQVISVDGFLSDHYNPLNKTVNLSPEVYRGQSVAAAAVAAHECGHAVQHATAYAWLTFRSKMVPAVQISSNLVQWVLIAGILALSVWQNNTILFIGIVLFAVTTLFSIVTLPVEFDASNRALAWLQNAGITTPTEFPKAKDALKWAAMTYVMSALASLATLLHYVMIFMGSRNDD